MALSFRAYTNKDYKDCLSLFDENCSEFFAPNEKTDFEEFLAETTQGYEVCLLNGQIAGAFGTFAQGSAVAKIDWILLARQAQGSGIGSVIMDRIITQAKALNCQQLSIATSHKAYRFFENKGAKIVSRKEHGWGPNMHKIDRVLDLG